MCLMWSSDRSEPLHLNTKVYHFICLPLMSSMYVRHRHCWFVRLFSTLLLLRMDIYFPRLCVVISHERCMPGSLSADSASLLSLRPAGCFHFHESGSVAGEESGRAGWGEWQVCRLLAVHPWRGASKGERSGSLTRIPRPSQARTAPSWQQCKRPAAV